MQLPICQKNEACGRWTRVIQVVRATVVKYSCIRKLSLMEIQMNLFRSGKCGTSSPASTKTDPLQVIRSKFLVSCGTDRPACQCRSATGIQAEVFSNSEKTHTRVCDQNIFYHSS